jgi:hypothetical protein
LTPPGFGPPRFESSGSDTEAGVDYV